MSTDNTNHYSEEEWLEFLEGEVPPSLEKDMRLLLKNSPRDREIVENLKLTRELTRASDGVQVPEDGEFWRQLQAKIMKEVNERPEPSAEIPKKRGTATRFIFGTMFI